MPIKMLVILVGFVYHSNKFGHKELAGNYVDLYHLYSYFSKITNNIIVMTDLSRPEDSSPLIDAINQNSLPTEIFTFDRVLSWKEKIKIYQSKKDMEELLD